MGNNCNPDRRVFARSASDTKGLLNAETIALLKSMPDNEAAIKPIIGIAGQDSVAEFLQAYRQLRYPGSIRIITSIAPTKTCGWVILRRVFLPWWAY